jgi:glycosyltransferase involved in cell wall biosynthesis
MMQKTISTSKTNLNQSDTIQWIESFRKKHGRPPRVLHIGNIANNAYNNAKLLNKAGVDCDVICYDYYHIMGCPEWEDADFDGNIKNQFYPNWQSVNLNGFERPKWFAQGPLMLCIYYLIARRDGKKLSGRVLWSILEIARFIRCSRTGIAAWNCFRAVRNFLRFVRNNIQLMRNYLFAVWIQWFPLGRLIFYSISFVCIPFIILYYLPVAFVVLPVKIIKRTLCCFRSIESEKYSFEDRVKELVKLFAKKFPERVDKLTENDLLGYKYVITLWRYLFSRYDIVQAYSTDVVLPMLANNRPYIGFEHGTLREIPFNQNPQGRRTALGYNLAKHVFVTNTDCLKNAHILADDRVSIINHPYDEDRAEKVTGWRELRQKLFKLLNSNFLFFFPTRHDWIPGSGYADKANNIFLHAFCRLRKQGYKIGMVCCNWGSNVQESIDLLKQHDCSQYVYWANTLGRIQFERTAQACHIVVDQFKLGSFGGIVFKAMAVGSPVCTYLEETAMHGKYSAAPPIINCRTEHEIVNKIKKLIENPAVLKDLSGASRDWVKKYHSSAKTVEEQLLIYKDCIEGRRLK